MADEELPQDNTILPPESQKEKAVQMPFLDHLEELRWRILKALAAILVGAVVCFIFSNELLKILTAPYEDAVQSLEISPSSGVTEAMQELLKKWAAPSPDSLQTPAPTEAPSLPPGRRLQALRPMTYFFISLQIALLGGLVLALPVVFYQAWKFLAPGLLVHEKHLLAPIVGLSVLCFAAGALVAYWIVLPIGLRFFLALEPPNMTSQWAVDEYIGFALRLILGFGIVFEMPVISLVLSRIGLLTPAHMRRFRRYAIVAIFVLAAIFTPPDPLSQLMMALPLLVLYEISIWICKVSSSRKETTSEE